MLNPRLTPGAWSKVKLKPNFLFFSFIVVVKSWIINLNYSLPATKKISIDRCFDSSKYLIFLIYMKEKTTK